MEFRGGGAGATNIMKIWIMEGYDVGLLIGVSIVVVIIVRRGDKGEGSILSGRLFEDSCDKNLACVSTRG